MGSIGHFFHWAYLGGAEFTKVNIAFVRCWVVYADKLVLVVLVAELIHNGSPFDSSNLYLLPRAALL